MIDLDALSSDLIRSVDAMTPEEYAAPSLLPGWTRAHVVAHLVLNAEGLAGALEGLARGVTVPMYPSAEERDAAIDALAAEPPADLRERLLAGTTRLAEAVTTLPEHAWDGSFPRVPGGELWHARNVLPARLREVQIHHADLGLAFSPADWDPEFATDLLDAATADHAASERTPGFAVRTDEGRTWAVGADEPVVSGPAYALGWWLVGRGSGEGLTCDAGDLPTLGPWVRAPRASSTPPRG